MAFAVRPHFSEFVSLCNEERERERQRAQGEDKKRAGVWACGRESTKAQASHWTFCAAQTKHAERLLVVIVSIVWAQTEKLRKRPQHSRPCRAMTTCCQQPFGKLFHFCTEKSSLCIHSVRGRSTGAKSTAQQIPTSHQLSRTTWGLECKAASIYPFRSHSKINFILSCQS